MQWPAAISPMKDLCIISPLVQCNMTTSRLPLLSFHFFLFHATSFILIIQFHYHFKPQSTMTSKPESLSKLFESIKNTFPASLGPEKWFLVVAVSICAFPSQDSPPPHSTHSFVDFRARHLLGPIPAGPALPLPDEATRVCFPASTTLPGP